MVFDEIYGLYENCVVSKLEETKTPEEIDTLEKSGFIQDTVLKNLALALTVAIYRNGKIEDIHAGEYDGPYDFDGIPDSCMKEINIDVCNKMYTMLKLMFSEDADDYELTKQILCFSALCALGWNEPEIDYTLYHKDKK